MSIKELLVCAVNKLGGCRKKILRVKSYFVGRSIKNLRIYKVFELNPLDDFFEQPLY